MNTPTDQTEQFGRYIADMDVYPVTLDELERYAKTFKPSNIMGRRMNPRECPLSNMFHSYGYEYVSVTHECVILGNSIRSCVAYRLKGGINSFIYKVTAVAGDRRYTSSFTVTAQQVLDLIANIRETRGEA